jgi:hypothetical protein
MKDKVLCSFQKKYNFLSLTAERINKKTFTKPFLQVQNLLGEFGSFQYYRALPRGNTSSGNTKRSCGWS